MLNESSTRLLTRAAFLEMENSRERCGKTRHAREILVANIYRELAARGVQGAEDLAQQLRAKWERGPDCCTWVRPRGVAA